MKNKKYILEKYPDLKGVQFGSNPPTVKQFRYAYALGVPLNKKRFTFETIAEAIDQAKAAGGEKRKADEEELNYLYAVILENSPASQDTLAEIKELHGAIPKGITNREAEEFVEYLANWKGECPFCGKFIDNNMDACFSCGKSLKTMKIPMPGRELTPQANKASLPQKKKQSLWFNKKLGCLLWLIVILVVILVWKLL